ncbi:MAG TPA: hypothetical protein VKB09_08465 [Thermomicrobiales bacterium]|nr:hypothetical protein [Thermomicrobiales bacterium]
MEAIQRSLSVKPRLWSEKCLRAFPGTVPGERVGLYSAIDFCCFSIDPVHEDLGEECANECEILVNAVGVIGHVEEFAAGDDRRSEGGCPALGNALEHDGIATQCATAMVRVK